MRTLAVALTVVVGTVVAHPIAAHSQKQINRGRGSLSKPEIRALAQIQARHESDIMALPGVQGIGIGMEDRQGAFVVFVDAEAPMPKLPSHVEAVPVVVEATPKIELHNGGCGCLGVPACHGTQEPLPAPMGHSISTDQGCGICTAGFVACIGQTRVFVTARHCNRDADGCSLGLFDYLERGLIDNHCSTSGPLPIGRTYVVAPLGADGVDAVAVASTVDATSCVIEDVGPPSNTWLGGIATMGACVKKSGRSSGLTFGRIRAINVTTNATHECVGPDGGSLSIPFTGLIGYVVDSTCGTCANPPCVISVSGDSGAAVLDVNNTIVALNIMGAYNCADENGDGDADMSIGFGTPIEAVITQLGITSLNTSVCGGCPLESCLARRALAGTVNAQLTLDSLRSFRDQVLRRTPVGRQYIDFFYENTAEATRLLLMDESLLAETRAMLLRFTPHVRVLMARGKVTLNPRDVQDVDEFLAMVSSLGVSERLRSAIEQVRQDLRDEGVLAQFGVRR